MKLKKLFEAKDQKLFKVDGGDEVEIRPEMAKTVKWSDVEQEAESYNEEYLAHLRDELKSLEEKNQFVFIVPVFDKDAPSSQFTAAMKHTARRIKDCVSVIGFAIPEEVIQDADTYIEELSAKHSQYCFFCKKSLKNDVILY